MATIVTGATGHADGDPDRVVVTLRVESRAEDAETARADLASTTDAVRDALADVGVPDGAVRTSGYDVSRRPPHQEGEQDEGTFQASHGLTVESTDVDAVGEVVDAAVGAGATRVRGVRFAFSEGRRRELRRRALADAMERARDQAEVIADSEDLSVTGVEDARTVETGRPRPGNEQFASASGDSGGTSFDGGPVQVTAGVEVTYEAE